MLGSYKPEDQQQSSQSRHLELMKELDEIKRYSAGAYDKVDVEVQEIRDTVRRLERQINENDRQIDKMERWDGVIRNIESRLNQIENSLRNLERKR